MPQPPSINIGATIWVMDPAVQTVANSIPMPDYVLDEVRSIPGVKYAVPLYSGAGLAKLKDGTYQAVNVMGLDDTSLFGRPHLLEGNIQDIFAENGFFVVRDAEYPKLENPRVGTEFELNDHRARIVGIAQVAFSRPVWHAHTLHDLQPRPPISSQHAIHHLLHPGGAQDRPAILPPSRRGFKAWAIWLSPRTSSSAKISDFYMYQTGLGINLLLMTVISFIVGLSISGQTFYTFIIENIDKFGALKAIGAKGSELVAMILFQATFTALTGFGLGHGILHAGDLAGASQAAGLCRHHHLRQHRACLRHGGDHRGRVQLCRRAQGLHIEPFDIFRS